jgi:hypothetical protein
VTHVPAQVHTRVERSIVNILFVVPQGILNRFQHDFRALLFGEQFQSSTKVNCSKSIRSLSPTNCGIVGVDNSCSLSKAMFTLLPKDATVSLSSVSGETFFFAMFTLLPKDATVSLSSVSGETFFFVLLFI